MTSRHTLIAITAHWSDPSTFQEEMRHVTGHSESVKASTAKKLLMGSFRSDEQASIQVASLSSGEVVFAYSANKANSAHGKQSTAEACAKHLKEFIEKK